MRVIQAADYGSAYPGSFVPMLRAVLRETGARDWEPLAVVPKRARDHAWVERLREEGFRVDVAPDTSRRALRRFLAELVDETEGPTVVHSHFTAFDLPAAAAVRRHRRAAAAYWHIHTVLGSGARAQLRNRVKFRLLSRNVERIVCVAPHLAGAVYGRGAPVGKVDYLPNGVDVDAFRPPSASERDAARRKHGFPPDATVLLHFGRDWLLKGGDLFLRAFDELRRERANLVAACVRGGEPARREAAALGIEDQVIVLDGTTDVWSLYAAADLFMATSRAEAAPLALLEALACGLGVVATDIPGHGLSQARAAHEVANLRIVPCDHTPLAEGTRSMLQRREFRASAQQSRQWVCANFGLDAWAARMTDLYAAVEARLLPSSGGLVWSRSSPSLHSYGL